ncbi:MAG TPA: class I SAM-dependent methyltransferase [Flavisolibacter sp.]
MQTKNVQGRLWSAAPADWARYVEPTFIPLYKQVLQAIAPDDTTMLLDAGCGSGLFLGMAKARGAHVHGIDAAPGLLAIGRKRLPGTTLLQEDLEDLPFRDETFDVVTGFNSFHYAGSFEFALAEARRVTKRGGRVVIATWGPESQCDATAVFRAVTNLLPPPLPGTQGPFAVNDEVKLKAIATRTGLRITHQQSVPCPWLFSSMQSLQRAFLSSGPFVKAVISKGEQKVQQVIYDSAQPFHVGDQVYYLENEMVFFVAERT